MHNIHKLICEYLDEEFVKCQTCLYPAKITHVSCYGDPICTECAESDDWAADGLPEPTLITEKKT